MRKSLCVTAVLAASLSFAGAQSTSAPTPPPSKHPWGAVAQLKPGTGITVRANRHTTHCLFQSASEDALVCTKTSSQVSFARTDVRHVEVPRRLRSTLESAGIGFGVGAVIGVAVSGKGSLLPRGDAIGAAGGGLGALGAILGAAFDPARKTVYEAP